MVSFYLDKFTPLSNALGYILNVCDDSVFIFFSLYGRVWGLIWTKDSQEFHKGELIGLHRCFNAISLQFLMSFFLLYSVHSIHTWNEEFQILHLVLSFSLFFFVFLSCVVVVNYNTKSHKREHLSVIINKRGVIWWLTLKLCNWRVWDYYIDNYNEYHLNHIIQYKIHRQNR